MAPHPTLGDRTFGLVFSGVFAALAGALWLASGAVPLWAICVAAGFLLVALLAPGALLPLNRTWSWLAQRLGRLVNLVLLGAFFHGVLLPVGLLLRLLARDPMARRRDEEATSYWTPVTRHPTPDNLADLF